jgi:hypothetical protein
MGSAGSSTASAEGAEGGVRFRNLAFDLLMLRSLRS